MPKQKKRREADSLPYKNRENLLAQCIAYTPCSVGEDSILPHKSNGRSHARCKVYTVGREADSLPSDY